MITLQSHINSVSFLRKQNSVSDYLNKLNINERLEYIRSVENTYPIESNLKQIKKLNNIFTRIDELVLGQFIMIEQIITGKTITEDYLVDFEILKLLIRPLEHKEFDNSDLLLEKQNEERILNMDVREAYWVLNKFINNREKILFNDFSGVFYEKDDSDITDEELESVEEKTLKERFGQQWYWYNIVRMLSGEDIHKYEKTYMLPMSVVLPEMSFLAQKNKIESASQRQQEAMRKL
jgi:hypothetical protein|tara:strand:+ start:37 stop:744 length:708 start_codon:yes stop_codon:yes gene_type:complete